MSKKLTSLACMTIVLGVAASTAAMAQDAAAPAAGAGQPAPKAAEPAPPAASDLPEVEVIQKKPAAQKKSPAPKKKLAKKAPPPPAPAPVSAPEPIPAPEPVAAPPTAAEARANGDVVPMSPVSGAEIPVAKYPGGVSTVPAAELARNPDSQAQDVLQKHVPGVILTDSAGSAFRSQVEYRGFGAGSVTGFPQGLAVYQNGVRINEVFGDVTNWDLIPSNAISDITILSGNPVFGLNAIGGAISILMKDGFSFQGVEIDALAGSFGRWQVGTQAGVQVGNWAAYIAAQKIEEDGFRDFSPVDIQRLYADVGARGTFVEMHANLTWADSSVGVATASPEDILDVGWNRTFTTPQVTDLEVFMPSINAKVKATDTLTLSGLAYYRRYKSNVIDGNLLEAEECDPPDDDFLCDEEGEQLIGQNGQPVEADALGVEPYGVIDNINQEAKSWGGSLQAVEKGRLFGLKNQFLVGTSYDRGNVRYGTASELGTIGPRYVVRGSGIFAVGPDDFAPRDVDVDTEYFGAYISDTLELTSQIALTVGGRYNYAAIDLVDLSGNFPDITSEHTFERFNPNVGLTYEFVPGITAYGGYSEANRAPTPAELACANPENPCPIESFLTDDPPLEQVITDTWEAGLRGVSGTKETQRVGWSVGLFRAFNENDILFVSSSTTGRGFFLNAGNTKREGVEAELTWETTKWSLYANYSYVRATYETENEISSPNNPRGFPCTGDDDENCILVQPGDTIPGIPRHRFKAGFDYWLTSKWKVGADLIAASGQYYLGDEANLLDQLNGYSRVDLHTSYDVTENFQIFAFVNNVFDRRYGVFGTLFDPEEATEAGEPSGYEITNPRGLVPAAPVSAYGGVKVKF